jgi:hypothetical protein
MTIDTSKLQAARVAARNELEAMPSCDFKEHPGRLVPCSWGCGGSTRNMTEIGDTCWRDRDIIAAARIPPEITAKSRQKGARLAQLMRERKLASKGHTHEI